jgi:hypothetical protein
VDGDAMAWAYEVRSSHNIATACPEFTSNAEIVRIRANPRVRIANARIANARIANARIANAMRI